MAPAGAATPPATDGGGGCTGCLTNAFEALVAPVERCIVKCTRPDTFVRFYALLWRRRVVAIVLIGALLAICAPIHRFAVMFVAFLFAIAFAIDYFWRRLVAPFVPEGVKCAPRTNAGKPVRELGAKIAYYIIILVAFSARLWRRRERRQVSNWCACAARLLPEPFLRYWIN